jgi:hypothetical protein
MLRISVRIRHEYSMTVTAIDVAFDTPVPAERETTDRSPLQ